MEAKLIKPYKKDYSKGGIDCNICDYNWKKVSPMNRHVNTKHCEQKGKNCGKGFKISIDCVCHVTQEHCLEKKFKRWEKKA